MTDATDTLNTASTIIPPLTQIEDLIERYTANLMRAAMSLNFSETESEELVQDTFYAYLKGGSRFEGRSRLLTYLFGILYNKARESRRFQGRYESIDAMSAVDPVYDSHFDSEEHWNQECMDQMSEVEKKAQTRQVGDLLKDCLEGLSAVMRMAFTLKEVEGLSSEDIGDALGLSRTNLGVVLFRARNKLRECLMASGAVIV